MINPITIDYVFGAPYFWLSMGMTTAVAIFVGAIIYDGELSNAVKGLISVLLYAFFIFQVDLTRLHHYFLNNPESLDVTRYAGIVTLVITTLFWVLGVILGVTTSRMVYEKK